MGKGRKQLPAEIKKLRGTAQPCREQTAGDSTAIAKLTDVKPPAWLDTMAKKIFKSKAEQLIALNVLTILDIDLLALYAQSYSLIVEALQKIKEEGKFNTLYNDEGQIVGFVENPYMKVYRDNFDKVQKLAGHFGFSPATRKSIMTMTGKKEDKDDFADFE
nr:MAG TPA: terminase small subunit [Caudoviricetes sp.]